MTRSPDILLIGAGGHARVLIDTMSATHEERSIGIIDADAGVIGQSIQDIPIIGTDAMLKHLAANGARYFAVAVGMNNALRENLFQTCLDAGLLPLTIVHPNATISPWATMGQGAQILPGAVVNAGAVLGVNNIINSGAVVEHDCILGDHVHVSSMACLAGGVILEDLVHVGAGAVIRQMIRVGRGTTIGIGAAVVKDIAPLQTVVGVPAKEISK